MLKKNKKYNYCIISVDNDLYILDMLNKLKNNNIKYSYIFNIKYIIDFKKINNTIFQLNDRYRNINLKI